MIKAEASVAVAVSSSGHDQMEQGLGNVTWWGFSPPEKVVQDIRKKQGEQGEFCVDTRIEIQVPHILDIKVSYSFFPGSEFLNVRDSLKLEQDGA